MASSWVIDVFYLFCYYVAMLKIRLQRFGKRNSPTFRMVLIDSHKGPKSGNFLEVLGSYDPKTKETTLKSERVLHWIEKGAQTSDTVHNFLVKRGVINGAKVDVASKKNVKTPEMIAEEEAAKKAEEEENLSSEASAEGEVAAEAPAEEAEAPPEETPTEEAPAEESTEEEKKD